MEIKNIMSKDYISIQRNSTIADVIKLFTERHQDIACVLEDSELIGIVTKYSLYRLLLLTNNIDSSVEDAIIDHPVTLFEDDNIYHSREKLIHEEVAHAVILDIQHRVVGIISKSNIFQGQVYETQYVSKQLSNLMNNLESIIISVDLQLEIVTLNNSACKLIDKSGINPNGKHIGDVFPELTEFVIDTIKTDQLIDYQDVELHKKQYISSFIPIHAWGQINGIMIVLENVSKYEKIAKELESTKRIEQTLDSALEVAYDGIVITDPNGVIVKVNQGFLDLLHLSSSDKVVHHPLKSVVPEISIEKSLLGEKQINGEYIKINGQKTVVTQTTIYRNNKNIGIIIKILFRQLELWKDLFSHMDHLENELSFYRNKLKEVTEQEKYFETIISASPLISNLKQNAYTAARGFSNILITGESGTGKELFAHGIHQASGRIGKFIKINCAAIPADLLESELFGYDDGAFTGAKKGGKPGKFELADKGTLFLDEIGEMPVSLQVKLLRVLQDRKFERVGGITTLFSDVRIVTATNRDLLAMVKKGDFRADLYYRINVIHLHIPPLRKRIEDITYLCDFFIQKFKDRIDKNMRGISPEALIVLKKYDWPGNIRELENVLERAFHFCKTEWITSLDIHLDVTSVAHTTPSDLLNDQHSESTIEMEMGMDNAKDILESTEKGVIVQALHKSKGNRTKAAKLLNISRSTLYYKLKKFDIKEQNKFS